MKFSVLINVYLQIIKGIPVASIVVFLPMDSIRGPPAMPPMSAASGMRLPIHEPCIQNSMNH